MQSLHYLFRIFQLLVTILVVVFAGVLILTALPVKGNIKLLTVLSGSMGPTIPVGSAVLIKPVDHYLTNEVITYARGGNEKQLVTHRIVATQFVNGEKQYITKGDANEDPDPAVVKADQVKGQVLLTVPYLGYVANWIKTPAGFVSLIVLPAAILIYGELMAVKNEMVRAWKKRHLGVLALLVVIAAGWQLNSNTQAMLEDREVSEMNTIQAWVEGTAVEVQTDGTQETTPTGEPSPTPPEGANLVINELLANPQTDFTYEWVEIYNPTGADVDLTDWALKDAANPAKSLSGLGTISAGGFKVYSDHNWLNNSGSETLQLMFPGTNVVDEVTYTGTSADVSHGRETDGGLPWKDCGTATQGSSNNGSC